MYWVNREIKKEYLTINKFIKYIFKEKVLNANRTRQVSRTLIKACTAVGESVRILMKERKGYVRLRLFNLSTVTEKIGVHKS